MSDVRLHVANDLDAGSVVGLPVPQAHYLCHVLRMGRGDTVHLFNGRDGEWRGAIEAVGRGRCSVLLDAQTRPQRPEPDLWLVFAPVKRARIDFIAAKATELGVSRLVPVFTRRTVIARVNVERLAANAMEAAEQCGRLTVPAVAEAVALDELIAAWPSDRRLLVCDETGTGRPVAAALAGARSARPTIGPWAVLTGPEGGFDGSELDLLRKLTIVTTAALGPRILRADTAAIAALACWQALLGDWRPGESAPGDGKVP